MFGSICKSSKIILIRQISSIPSQYFWKLRNLCCPLYTSNVLKRKLFLRSNIKNIGSCTSLTLPDSYCTAIVINYSNNTIYTKSYITNTTTATKITSSTDHHHNHCALKVMSQKRFFHDGNIVSILEAIYLNIFGFGVEVKCKKK